MRYLGGKSRYARAIAAVINPIRGSRTLWDPFCGGLASAAAFGGELVCSDVNPGLIALYREVQRDPRFLDAFEEPGLMTRELFAAAKAADPACPVATLIKIGGSFGGDIHTGGYQREYRDPRLGPGKSRSFLGEAVRSLRRQFRTLGGAYFDVCDFLAVEPAVTNAVLYLDPPYPETTGYGVEFDHELFRVRARAWAAVTDVWVSGYAWPSDAGKLVWEARASSRWAKRGLRPPGLERLWKVRP